MIFEIDYWLRKSNFGTFWHPTIIPILKIQSFPLRILIFGQNRHNAPCGRALHILSWKHANNAFFLVVFAALIFQTLAMSIFLNNHQWPLGPYKWWFWPPQNILELSDRWIDDLRRSENVLEHVLMLADRRRMPSKTFPGSLDSALFAPHIMCQWHFLSVFFGFCRVRNLLFLTMAAKGAGRGNSLTIGLWWLSNAMRGR